MWNDFLKNTVLKPGLERLGSMAAVLLLTGGDWLCSTVGACGLVTAGGAEMVMTWVCAAALLAFDLVVIQMRRKAK